MSLLIKALRQAEKQNEQAARRAAEVAIDMPLETEPGNAQMNSAPTASPLSSALSLAVETHAASIPPDDQQALSASDFPTLDEDFAPKTDQQPESEPELTHSRPTRPVDSGQQDEDQPSSLSLETVGTLPTIRDGEAPAEMFARHGPETSDPLAPEPEPDHALEALQSSEPTRPVETASVTSASASASQKPEQSNADDPISEAAPYLAVKSAVPTRRFSRTPIAVLIGLPIVALLLAAVTAATVWWSGNQAYDVDFNAPTAQPTRDFAANDQPLSQLNLGVAVEGTSSPLVDTSSSADRSSVDSTAGSSATPPEQLTLATTSPTPLSSPKGSSPKRPAPAVDAANDESSVPPPARRVLARQAVAASVPAAAARPALPAVRFVRSVSRGEQSQQLMNDAYQALQRNELELAKTAYQQALRIDRNQIDGWVGLASVAARQGNKTLASQHYQRALNIDPNDNVARTGLLSLVGSNLTDESESALRTLIGSGQQNAMAELTLANTLARQGRWAEAQQAYFNANAAQPNQPDTIFNLAVSLERIRQSRAALSHYERALELSESNQTLFDPGLARQRISALKQQLQEQ